MFEKLKKNKDVVSDLITTALFCSQYIPDNKKDYILNNLPQNLNEDFRNLIDTFSHSFDEKDLYKNSKNLIDFFIENNLLLLKNENHKKQIPILWTNFGLNLDDIKDSEYISDSESEIFSFLWILCQRMLNYSLTKRTKNVFPFFENLKNNHIEYDKVLSQLFVEYLVTEDLYDEVKLEFGQNNPHTQALIDPTHVCATSELPLLFAKVAQYNVEMEKINREKAKLTKLCGHLNPLEYKEYFNILNIKIDLALKYSYEEAEEKHRNLLHFQKQNEIFTEAVRIKVSQLLDLTEQATKLKKERLTLEESRDLMLQTIKKVKEITHNSLLTAEKIDYRYKLKVKRERNKKFSIIDF